MSRKAECLICGTRQSAFQLEHHGCWACAREATEAEDQEAFETFMALDEEARWRLLWEHAGQPT